MEAGKTKAGPSPPFALLFHRGPLCGPGATAFGMTQAVAGRDRRGKGNAHATAAGFLTT